jgi:hypothetical protein
VDAHLIGPWRYSALTVLWISSTESAAPHHLGGAGAGQIAAALARSFSQVPVAPPEADVFAMIRGTRC